MAAKTLVRWVSIVYSICFVVSLNGSDSKSMVVTFHPRPLTAEQKLEYERQELLKLFAFRKVAILGDEEHRLKHIKQFSHAEATSNLLRYWHDTKLRVEGKKAYQILLPTMGDKVVATVLFRSPQAGQDHIVAKGYRIANFYGKDTQLLFSVYSKEAEVVGPIVFGLGLCPLEIHCLHETEKEIANSIAPTRKNSLADEKADGKKA